MKPDYFTEAFHKDSVYTNLNPSELDEIYDVIHSDREKEPQNKQIRWFDTECGFANIICEGKFEYNGSLYKWTDCTELIDSIIKIS